MAKTQYTEVMEAISVGNAALEQLSAVERELRRSGRRMGRPGLHARSGLLGGVIRRAKQERAREAMDELNLTISRFNREISDVHVSSIAARSSMGSGVLLADWFFENLVVDSLPYSRNEEARWETAELRESLNHAMGRLNYVKNRLEAGGMVCR